MQIYLLDWVNKLFESQFLDQPAPVRRRRKTQDQEESGAAVTRPARRSRLEDNIAQVCMHNVGLEPWEYIYQKFLKQTVIIMLTSVLSIRL